MIEKTFAIIKPDAHDNHQKIIQIYEKNGLRVTNIRRMAGANSIKELNRLYVEHEGKPFYSENLEHMSSGFLIAMILRGENAIQVARNLNGSTNPEEAAKGTIRQIYGTKLPKNAVHASASKEDAAREIGIFFPSVNFFDD